MMLLLLTSRKQTSCEIIFFFNLFFDENFTASFKSSKVEAHQRKPIYVLIDVSQARYVKGGCLFSFSFPLQVIMTTAPKEATRCCYPNTRIRVYKYILSHYHKHLQEAAIAQWIRLSLPSYGTGFESQAQRLCFFNLFVNCGMKRAKINYTHQNGHKRLRHFWQIK